MRTFCPHCQTTFRITSEQLRMRAGKVRCGQCQTVFNALDCLLDETGVSTSTPALVTPKPPVQPVVPATTWPPLAPAPNPAPESVSVSVPEATKPIPQPEPEPKTSNAPLKAPPTASSFPPTGLLDFPTSFPSGPAIERTSVTESPAAPAPPEWPTLPNPEEFPPPLATQSLSPLDDFQRSSPELTFAEERAEPRFIEITGTLPAYSADDIDGFHEPDGSNEPSEFHEPDAFTQASSQREHDLGAEPVSRSQTNQVVDHAIDDADEDLLIDPSISESRLRELGQTSGLIMPRDTREISGYSRWAEDAVSSPMALPDERATRWPFVLVALLLALLLTGQVVFHYRSEIAITVPSLKPFLQLFSETFNSRLPLPRHVERVSIESSDLQTDRARNNLLLLTATVRNRARYEQAYPSLELSLTDTGDTAIVRRVFGPQDYLPPAVLASQPFAASSDVAVRVWIDAKDVTAAGYRLYVFYP